MKRSSARSTRARRVRLAAVGAGALAAAVSLPYVSSALFTDVDTHTGVLGTAAVFPAAKTGTGHEASNTTSEINLSWTPVDAEEYEIYRCTPTPDGGCSGSVLIATVPGTQASYTDSGLDAATDYLYLVMAVSGDRSKQIGAWVSWTKPGAPQELRITASSVESVTLAWDKMGQSGQYKVYRDGTLVGTTDTTRYEVRGGLAWDTSYEFTVTAVHHGMESPVSTAVVKKMPVFDDGSLGGSWSATSSTITLTWPQKEAAKDYNVNRCAANPPVNKALGKPVTASSVTGGTPSYVTDGDARTNGSTRLLTSGGANSLQHIVIDLGEATYLDRIRVWHYSRDGRTYNGTKTEISEDGVNWTTIFDSATEGTYQEPIDGKLHVFPRQKVRYIRDWAAGNTSNGAAHWSEIEAWDTQESACTLTGEGTTLPASATSTSDTAPSGSVWLHSVTALTDEGRTQATYWMTWTVPTKPTNLRHTGSSSSPRTITIAWDPVPGTDVVYRIWRNGLILSANWRQTSFTDDDNSLPTSGTVTYTVEAVNPGGTSGPSAELTVPIP